MVGDLNKAISSKRLLATAPGSLSDLATFDRGTDPAALLQSTAGEFAADMARIFPKDWAWAALAIPRSTRQIWYAVLSDLPALPADCTHLRCNLLSLDLNLMMRLRFYGLSQVIRGIVTRIEPHPLPRGHYDELNRMLNEDLTLIGWYEGQTKVIDTRELTEILSNRIEDRAASRQSMGGADV